MSRHRRRGGEVLLGLLTLARRLQAVDRPSVGPLRVGAVEIRACVAGLDALLTQAATRANVVFRELINDDAGGDERATILSGNGSRVGGRHASTA